MERKRLTKTLWYGSDVDNDGNPIVPSAAPEDRHLDGLNEGEIYIHNHPDRPSLYIRTTDGKVVPISGNDLEMLSMYFLSRQKDDTAKGVITFEKGWITKEFLGGLLGKGAKVDEAGQAELHSLFVRTFMEVPEFRKNRVTVRMGDSVTSCSAGIVKSVNILSDTSGTIELKLEDGEFGSLEVDDIVFQIFSDMENKENNSTETSDDGKGNRTIKGFSTVMFKVTGVSGERNEIVAYSLRPLSANWKKQVHPFQFGTFSQRGNFDNSKPERQIVIYEGIYPQPYTRYMFGVNDWEFSAKMIGMQLGDLSNLSVFGMDMSGYSAYLNNVYFTGQIRQLYIPQWMDGESSAQNGTLVFMGGDHYVAKGDTDNPPLFDLMDEDGNSLLFTDEDGEGNLLDLNNDEYDMLAKKGDDGVGIKSNVSYYLISETNSKPSESSLEWSSSMVRPTDLKPYLWKKTVVTYTNLVSQTTIECISVRGKDGTSVSIKGSYNSEAELMAAFPNGPANASDAYIVGGDLYVWTGSVWKNVGAIKGEKGDTAYIHLKYANETSSGTQVNVGGSVVTLSFTSNDGEDMGDWLGIYTDYSPNDSKNIADYKWKNIKGSKGDDATSYQMDSPIGVINFTSDGYPNPTSFVVSVKKQTGNGNMVACSDFYLATWRYDGSWQLVSVSSVKTSSVIIIPAASFAYKQYRVTAHSTTSVSEANIIIEKGVGVSFDGMKGADGKDGKDGENGKDGEDGIFVYDCGLYNSTRAYFYKTIDGEVRRDKMVYEIGGAFYNFLVRSRQSDSSTGLVNTPPTSAAGDANWEVMSQFQSLIANTVFGTNANIGGFMTSAEKMISQSGMFELNGSNGTMTMHQSGGTTWSVDENGVQSVGNENGERIVIDPNSKSMSVFDAEGIERTTFDGNEYTREQLVVTNGGSFTLNANASNAGGKQLTSRGEEYETVSYPISGGLNASYVGVVQVSLFGFDASIVYEHDGATSDEILGIPSGRVSFYLNTYTGNGGTLISKKLIATKTIDGIQALQSRLIDGVYSVSAPSGYHQVVAEMSVCNFSKKGYATLTAKWSISSVILSVESYISRHFANGMMLSKSSSEYFMAMVESGKMVVEMASNGSRHSFKDGVYSVNGIKQPVVVYAARVTDTSESSSVQPSKTEFVNNGVSASLTKTTTTGRYTLTLPVSYGLTGSNMMVCLTGYGTSAGETAPIKATLLSYSASASSMVLTIATSDDSSPNYGGFYIEIKKIV